MLTGQGKDEALVFPIVDFENYGSGLRDPSNRISLTLRAITTIPNAYVQAELAWWIWGIDGNTA
jgi:hypothetical protein